MDADGYLDLQRSPLYFAGVPAFVDTNMQVETFFVFFVVECPVMIMSTGRNETSNWWITAAKWEWETRNYFFEIADTAWHTRAFWVVCKRSRWRAKEPSHKTSWRDLSLEWNLDASQMYVHFQTCFLVPCVFHLCLDVKRLIVFSILGFVDVCLVVFWRFSPPNLRTRANFPNRMCNTPFFSVSKNEGRVENKIFWFVWRRKSSCLFAKLLNIVLFSHQTAQTIGFNGEGFVELPSEDLGRNGDLSFSFRTRQEEALLVLAQGTAPQVPSTVCVTPLLYHYCSFHTVVARCIILWVDLRLVTGLWLGVVRNSLHGCYNYKLVATGEHTGILWWWKRTTRLYFTVQRCTKFLFCSVHLSRCFLFLLLELVCLH